MPQSKPDSLPDFAEITPTAQIQVTAHGWRAKCLQRLVRLDLPVPETVALPAATVRAIAAASTRRLHCHAGGTPCGHGGCRYCSRVSI